MFRMSFVLAKGSSYSRRKFTNFKFVAFVAEFNSHKKRRKLKFYEEITIVFRKINSKFNQI